MTLPNSQGDTATIVWCGDGSARVAGNVDNVHLCNLHNLNIANAELVVLQCEYLPLDRVRHECENLAVPVLLVVRPEALTEVLTWVRDEDDICLTTDPPLLIQRRIQRLAAARALRVDPLTGLARRRHFMSVLEKCGREASGQRPVSLILADMDHFKAINDRHGHAVGDQILQRCGELLQNFRRPGLLPARFAGEQFAVLMTGGEADAFNLAEETRQQVSELSIADDLRVTISLGVAGTCELTEGQSLVRRAEEALYAAKARGRDITVRYSDVEYASIQAGDDVEVTGLENRARVLAERVANFITLRSKRLLHNVRIEADTDGLTQFYNRRYFDRRLSAELKQVAASKGELTVALMDLDHFGQVNKRHGWPTGDKVLREVSQLIREHLRSTDWVGRYGGEEFCVVMPHTSLRDACVVLERLRETVASAQIVSTSGQPVPVTLSIGIAENYWQDNDPLVLLERTSAQTLAAKNGGRNRLCAEQPAMPK